MTGGMTGQFRSNVWDPILIASQIICMQSLYYTTLGLWIVVMDFIMHGENSLEQLFKYEELQVKNLHGVLIMAAFVLNALTCASALWIVVRRTKQCLDFTATVHLIHLVICWIYNSQFPNTLSWWLVNVVCVIISTVMGEYLCMRTELKAIPIMGAKADL